MFAIRVDEQTNKLRPTPNLTLINFVLQVIYLQKQKYNFVSYQITGPLREDHLCSVLLFLQVK